MPSYKISLSTCAQLERMCAATYGIYIYGAYTASMVHGYGLNGASQTKSTFILYLIYLEIYIYFIHMFPCLSGIIVEHNVTFPCDIIVYHNVTFPYDNIVEHGVTD